MGPILQISKLSFRDVKYLTKICAASEGSWEGRNLYGQHSTCKDEDMLPSWLCSRRGGDLRFLAPKGTGLRHLRGGFHSQPQLYPCGYACSEGLTVLSCVSFTLPAFRDA